jgi:hypothetical protein
MTRDSEPCVHLPPFKRGRLWKIRGYRWSKRQTSLVLPWRETEPMSLLLVHTATCFRRPHCLMLPDGADWRSAQKIACAADHTPAVVAALQPGTQSGATPLGTPAGKLHRLPSLFPAGQSDRTTMHRLRRPPSPGSRGPIHPELRLVHDSTFDIKLNEKLCSRQMAPQDTCAKAHLASRPFSIPGDNSRRLTESDYIFRRGANPYDITVDRRPRS